ncbi:hypothetical protein F5876DRAFT_70420 [Lentinula aff. lateritia]|uniref:Uncharacterized protein n=1 Tax=Lentinula aff. lateritia TaxID=2804960 RepID=A0ACC1TJ18_9AGAR|nr:hypothetical protein F5876DRAFT_70420 [Lentinula aff. lateritia]
MAANRPQETDGIRLCRLTFSFFVHAQAGMSDGSLGGWLLASFLNIYLLYYLDTWGTLILASISNIIGSAIIVSAPPFPIFVIALFFIGIGACIYDASFAAYTAHFDEGPAMSLLFLAFGFCALIAPLVVVAMLENDVPWNTYYYVPLGILMLNVPLLWIIFGSYNQSEIQIEGA